jgi:ABC-2 type transport system ATP-binding protein
MADAIRTEGLTKFYGKVRGIEGLDLTVRVGEVFGYLGPNGAGKTTTIRLLLDLIRPTAGRAEVLGLDTRAASLQVRRRLGYLPGELHLYENMSGRELVRYLGALRGRDDRDHAAELAERLELDLDRPIKSLSKGNKQKVGLVQALAHRPELLVLDEPTSGLDPLVQHEFHRMLDEARRDGRTVLLSSHDLAEVEHIADRVGIIRSGRLVAVDAIADLKAKAVHRLELHFGGPVPADAFADLPGVRDLQVEGTTPGRGRPTSGQHPSRESCFSTPVGRVAWGRAATLWRF